LNKVSGDILKKTFRGSKKHNIRGGGEETHEGKRRDCSWKNCGVLHTKTERIVPGKEMKVWRQHKEFIKPQKESKILAATRCWGAANTNSWEVKKRKSCEKTATESDRNALGNFAARTVKRTCGARGAAGTARFKDARL